MLMKTQVGLSSDLSSLYRLVLRATAASVLHHPTVTRNLRKLYRPVFVEAAWVEYRIRDTSDYETREGLIKWLVAWNERVENTLEFLHSSAISRGLSHRVTRNMGFLTEAHLKSQRPKPVRGWDPHLPVVSPLYSPAKRTRTEKEEKRLNRERLDAIVFHSVDEVVRLAEGRSGVTLGRLPPTRPI